MVGAIWAPHDTSREVYQALKVKIRLQICAALLGPFKRSILKTLPNSDFAPTFPKTCEVKFHRKSSEFESVAFCGTNAWSKCKMHEELLVSGGRPIRFHRKNLRK